MKKILSFVVAALLLAGALKADPTSPGLTPLTDTAATVLSSTATALNLTTTASCPVCKLFVSVFAASSGGAVAFAFGGVRSMGVAPGSLAASLGPYQAASGASALVYGPFNSGTYLFLIGTTTTANVKLHFDQVP